MWGFGAGGFPRRSLVWLGVQVQEKGRELQKGGQLLFTASAVAALPPFLARLSQQGTDS